MHVCRYCSNFLSVILSSEPYVALLCRGGGGGGETKHGLFCAKIIIIGV